MQSKPNSSDFARTKLPWLAAGAILLIYLITLNHWVSIRSMPVIAKVTGWDWSLPTQMPLFYLLTYPFRILPASIQPVALNFFAALCSALTIALLVRSVALLPHDRTDEQRLRQRSSDALLSTRFAWAPPVLAAAVLGFELTMWEHSTAATNETLNLLVFAYLIRALLEFRLSKNEAWLSKMAFVYGLGITNNWALVGFFPFFLGALIWIRGKAFFNLAFIARMTALGLTGMLLYLLLPLVWTFKDTADNTFGELLRSMLVEQKRMILDTPSLRARALILSLTSVVPVIIMGIRFPAGFGDVSSAGASITNLMFRVIHIVFAAACIFVAFDQQVSPRSLGLGLPFLTFYYLGALAAGYYVGYLMLVFAELPKKHWRPASPFSKLINPVIQALAWAAVILVPIALVIKNFKAVHSQNGKLLMEFAETVAAQLPQKPAILLSEDPFQLGIMEAWYARKGGNPHILVNPRALPFPVYHRDMVRRYPGRWPEGAAKEDLRIRIDSVTILVGLNTLARSNQVFYLHPSFGYFFEQFSAVPTGLISELKVYPTNVIFAPRLNADQMRANEDFWRSAEGLVRRAEALTPLKMPDAVFVANHFSRALNKWGVDLQRANRYTNATQVFELAASLNTNNLPAELNLEYNQFRLYQKPRERTEQKLADDFFGQQYRSWDGILADNGPFDVPEYLFAQGRAFLQNSLYRQAADVFARSSALLPTNNAPRLGLISALISGKWLDTALSEINVLNQATNTTRSQKMDLISMEAAVHFARQDTNRAETLLRSAMTTYTNEPVFYDSLSELYRASGQWQKAFDLSGAHVAANPSNLFLRLQRVELALSLGNTNAAASELDAVEKISPGNVDAAMLRIFLAIRDKDYKKGEELVKGLIDAHDKNPQLWTYKGILHMEQKQDEEAVEAFDKALKLDASYMTAIQNRAIVHLRSGRLNDAKKDYDLLFGAMPRSHQILYGLGEIAYQKKDNAEALKHYEAYLKYAPKDGPAEERKKVETRAQELKAAAK